MVTQNNCERKQPKKEELSDNTEFLAGVVQCTRIMHDYREHSKNYLIQKATISALFERMAFEYCYTSEQIRVFCESKGLKSNHILVMTTRRAIYSNRTVRLKMEWFQCRQDGIVFAYIRAGRFKYQTEQTIAKIGQH